MEDPTTGTNGTNGTAADGRRRSSWSRAHPAGPQARRRSAATRILMAAMLGIVEALGWERPSAETVEVADSPLGEGGLKLDYHHLDPLDP